MSAPVDRTPTIGMARATAPVVYVCITCRPNGQSAQSTPPGAILAEAVARAAAGSEVDVRPLRCLGNCNRAASAALRTERSWTYVFGGLDESCAQALIDGARLLALAPDGILPWRGRPAPLKRGLVARVPPLDFNDAQELCGIQEILEVQEVQGVQETREIQETDE